MTGDGRAASEPPTTAHSPSTVITYPGRFAALAPVCARGDPTDIARIAHVPVWAFHGDADTVVEEAKGQAMVDAHRAAGGIAGYTIYPGGRPRLVDGNVR